MPRDRNAVIRKGIITAIALLLIYFIFFRQSSQGIVLPVPPVIVQKPQPMEMTEYITQTGNTVAYNSVDLVARVEGYLTAINFADGTFVKKNQELFIIEPKPYQEKLNEAKASVVAQKAGLAYSKSEYERQKRMYKDNATSLNNVEKWLARSQEYEAEVSKAIANEEIAAINYGYTHVLAPFNGRIGRHLVDVGNLVGNGKATTLANIEQLDPIYVYFNLSELDLIRIREAARANGMKPSDINKIPVYVSMQNETGFKHKGHLDFVNTSLDASMGTMEFRGVIPNKDVALLPGLFVQVRIAIAKPAMQLTVPDTAVLYDQRGSYLLTVDQQDVVRMKRVTLGNKEGDRRAVLKGLSHEDKVIVSGLQNATPGNKVVPKEEVPAA